jgi:hypothetical protein
VIWNEACERWLGPDGSVPGWVERTQRAISVFPQAWLERLIVRQRPGLPLFGPYAPVRGMPGNLLDAGALYAGESVARMHDVRPAGDLVRELAG